MAKQQPEQSFFIPRVAGVPQPPPQLQPQFQPQPQPQSQLPVEFEAPVDEEVFEAQPLPPPEPPVALPPLAPTPTPTPFIGRTPFPVPPKSGGGLFRSLARYCWLAVPLWIVVNLVMTNLGKVTPWKDASQVTDITLGVIGISGIVSGIIALFGIRPHGRKGIQAPALAGLCLWMIMIALLFLMFPVFQKLQERASQENTVATSPAVTSSPQATPASVPRKAESIAQSPPAQPDGSTRVEDKEFGFSFAALEGYMAESESEPAARHSYKRKFVTEPTRIIEIREFEGDYSRHLAAADNFPPPPPGQTSESAVFDWRGRKVGGTRSVDAKRNPSYLTLNIVIPLRKQSIVVTVGGAEEYEPVLQEVVDQVLGSLAEEPGS